MTAAHAKDLEHGLGRSDNQSNKLSHHGDPTQSVSHSTQVLNVQKEELNSSPNIHSSASAREDEFYPEGGFRAYSVVFGSFCGMLAGFGLLNTIGTYQAYLATHQLAHYSESEVGWIFGLYAFLSFFCGVQIGPVFDAKGPRWLIFAGSVFLVGGMLGVANSTEYWHFVLTFSIVSGIGTSLLFTPSISAIGHWFQKGRGGATGLANTGGSIGGIVFPLMLQKLFSSVGFAWATRILAMVMLVLVTIANLLIRSRLPPKAGGSVWPDFQIFRNIPFALTTASTFFMEWALFVPVAYLSSYALRYGMPDDFAYQVIAILNAGSFFGRWVPGFLADHWGRFNLLIITLAGCLLSVFAIWFPAHGNMVAIIIFALGFGFSSGSNISLTPVCVGQLCDTENYGRWFATCYTVVSISCLTGIPIAGQILTADHGNYWGLILFTGFSYLTAISCAISARVSLTGWKIFVVV